MADTSTIALGTSSGIRWSRLQDLGIVLASIALLLIVWKLGTVLADMPSYILPAPEDVFRSLWSGVAVPFDDPLGFYQPLASTMMRAAQGFAIGALLGLVLGSLMAEFRPLEKLLMPYAFGLQSLPKVALAPLIIIWTGFGDGSKIAMAALLTFFPMLVNSFAGLRSTNADRIDLMQSLSASRLETYYRVKLPSAAPFIFAGIDMAVVYALLGVIVAEFLGAQRGMGVLILRAQSVTDTATVFAALIVLGAIGILLHLIVKLVEHRCIHWAGRG